MADLGRVRKRLTVVSGALAGISLLAGLYLLVPIGPTNTELYKELDAARIEWKQKELQVKPLRGLPEKIVTTHSAIGKFYQERFSARQSAVAEELGKLATGNGVNLTDVKYESLETDVPSLRYIALDAQLSGEYSKVARFINAVERDKTFFIVDGLTLNDEKAGSVRLQLKMETYLRSATAGNADNESRTESVGKGSKTGD